MLRVILPILMTLAIGSSVIAEQLRSPESSQILGTNLASKTLSPKDIAAYTDAYMPLALAEGDIASAVVSVVKDGKVIYSGGYGFADVEKQKKVKSDQTLYRIGSVSKLFIWISLMQLAERGELDLDADINRYLDFEVPQNFGKPITVKNLMTHTAGFEETLRNLMVRSAEDIVSPRDYLVNNMPGQMFSPGETVAYSNYGAYLASYIVERVSKKTFNEFVDENIFAPLGMTNSTFEQPLPKRLRANMATGYRQVSTGPREFEILQVGPAGSMSSTATDMAKFMNALLAMGREEEAGILSENSFKKLLSRQFAQNPKTNGVTFGFLEDDYAGVRSVGHAGATLAFISDLHIFPDQNVGVFVSMNSFGPQGAAVYLQKDYYRNFVERYLSPANASIPTAKTAEDHAAIVTGRYQTTRRVDNGPFNFATLLSQAKVSADDDGILTVSNLLGLDGMPKKWREVGEFEYQAVGSREKLSFVMNKNNRPAFFTADDARGIQAFQSVPFWQNAGWNIPLLVFTLVVFAGTWLLWPVAAFVRRSYAGPSPDQVRLRLIVRVAVLLCVTSLGGWLIWLASSANSLTQFTSNNLIWFHLLQVLGWIGLLATVAAALLCYTSWKAKQRSVWVRLGWTLVALASFAYAWLGFAFELLIPGRSY